MPELRLRYAEPKDDNLLFEWANDPDTRKTAVNKNNIKWEEHIKWFKAKLSSTNCYLYVLEDGDIPLGQIRFEKHDNKYEISYSIDKKQRGRGLGKKIVQLGIEKMNPILKTFLVVV